MIKVRQILQSIRDTPAWYSENLIFAGKTGSHAYGCSTDQSDTDIICIVIPPKKYLFPNLYGHIDGFGNQPEKFYVAQKQNILFDGNEYDIQIYNIAAYFDLCMKNNPNLIDTLYLPVDCILYNSPIATKIFDNRRKFLSKLIFHKFRGYAYSQLHKLRNKNPGEQSKRKELIEKYGFDVKFASHTIRLMDEAHQILSTGELNLRQSAAVLKSIRRGEWTLSQIEDYFTEQENVLRTIKDNSSPLPEKPNEEELRSLLLECIYMHYEKTEQEKKIFNIDHDELFQEIMELCQKGLRK